MTDPKQAHSDAAFLRRLLLAVLVLGLVWLCWQLRFVLVLAFGAILFAVILNAASRPLQNRLHFPAGASLAVAILLIIAAFVATFALFGAEIARQAEAISEALPAAFDETRRLAGNMGLSAWLDARIEDISRGSVLDGKLSGVLFSVGDGLANLVILLVGGIFLAARPGLYRTGLIKLVPPANRGDAATALDDCRRALGLWLKGRLLAMLMVGVLTAAGLWLIGIPSYLALGLLAALLEFIPFFGPILAAVPAILLALLVGPTEALLVLILFLVIQQLEGNLISPIIQHHAVKLPPAMLLFALLAFGILFGLLGVVLAEPLTVAIFVLVKRLYVREALGTKTPMPGEEGG